MKMDLGQRPVGLERRVEHVEPAGVPPPRGRMALDGVSAFAHRPPDGCFEWGSFERVKEIQQLEVARLLPVRHPYK